MIVYFENEGSPLTVDTIELAHNCAKSTMIDSDLDTLRYCVIDFDNMTSKMYIMKKSVSVSFSITEH